MKRILYTDSDGNLAIVIPTGEISIDEVIAKDIPNDAEYKIVDEAEIPQDRIFRNAWKYDKTKPLDVDMIKAKNISHDIRRRERAKLFKELDVQATIPSMSAEAETKRQAIRDNDAIKQQNIDLATTPEELKAILEL